MEDDKYIRVAVRDYIDKEVGHVDEKYKIILEKNTEALRKAEGEMNRRLEGMNEFRASLKDQAATFIRRDEYVSSIEALRSKIDTLQRFVYVGIGGIIVIEAVFKFFIK